MTAVSDNAFPKVIITEGSAPATPASGKQTLYIDSADHVLKAKNSAGVSTAVGGGITLAQADPYCLHHRGSGSDAFDDEFDTNTLGSYTTVTPSGTATWAQGNHCMGVYYTGISGAHYGVLLKAITISDGQWLETCIRGITETLKNHTFYGLILTNGTLSSSNFVSAEIYTDSSQIMHVRNSWGTLTSNAGASTAIDLETALRNGAVRLKLKRISSTAYNWELAPESGIPWQNWAAANVNPSFTPTYGGLLVSNNGGSFKATASFDYLRLMS